MILDLFFCQWTHWSALAIMDDTRLICSRTYALFASSSCYILGPNELTKFAVFSTFIYYIFEAQKAFIVFFFNIQPSEILLI